MRSNFTEANHATILEMCLNADSQHSQQLHQQLESVYLRTFGLDYLIDDQKRTILHVLAAKSDFIHWEIVLKGFVYLDGTDSHLQTALHISVLNRNLNAIKSLIENCASPTVEDEHGNNPIQLCCQINYPQGLTEILKSFHAKQFIAANSIRIGQICIENKSKETFSVLISNLSSLSNYSSNYSSNSNTSSLLNFSFTSNSNSQNSKINAVDDEGFALIHHVIFADLPDYLRILVQHKADVNLKAKIDKVEKYPIEMSNSSEITEILFSMNAQYNKKAVPPMINDLIVKSQQWQQTGRSFGLSDLHRAVKESNLNFVKQFKGKIDVVDSFGKTPLILAIKNKSPESLAIIDELLNKGADPTLKSELMSMTAYHYACLRNNEEALKKFILKKQPNFSVLDKNGRSLMTCCVANGSVNCLKTLLSEFKPSLDTSVNHIIAYLLRLDDSKAAAIAEILLNFDFPLNIPTENDKTILREAFDQKMYQLCDVILKFKTNSSSSKNNLSRNLTQTQAQILDKKGLLSNSVGEIHIAPGDLSYLQSTMNVQKNNNFDESDEICFVSAVVDELPIVESFLLAGANPEINHAGRPLIHDTASHKTNETRKLLIKYNETIKDARDSMQSTFLHRACALNNTCAIQDGLSLFEISPNTSNNNGDTPLHYLMHKISNNPNKHSDLHHFGNDKDFETNLQILMDAKADLKALNNKKQNIFHICAEHNNSHAVEVLINTIPEEITEELINQMDSDQKTPLQIASKKNETSCAKEISKLVQLPIFDHSNKLTMEDIESLINENYSLNIYGKEGIPLLTLAVKMFPDNPSISQKIVEKMLESGADPSIQDLNPTEGYNEPLRPLHHAIIVGSIEISKILISSGASFCVSPGTMQLAEDFKMDEIAALVKLPERRAGSIEELYNNQKNSKEIIMAVLNQVKNNDEILKYPKIELYISEMFFMHRLLFAFVERLGIIFFNLKPNSEIGNFLNYFSDAFLPILGMGQDYGEAMEILKEHFEESFLKLPIGIGVQTVDDAIIVPTQLFTRYTDLIKAVIKVTLQDHPDFVPLQKALNKFSYIGRQSNERKLIVESQKELQVLKLVTTINDTPTQFSLNDILYSHGQFEKKVYKKPGGPFENEEKNDPIAESSEWGLKIIQRRIGNLDVTCYNVFGSSLESFLSKAKIAIFLFRNSILFGVQKTSDKFKLKFSCKSSEVLWDFGREHGQENIMIYTPFGSMLLKIVITKDKNVMFERNRWRSDVDKLSVIPEGDEESIGGYEHVYASWVGEETKCVHSHLFHVTCKTKTEAKEKILQKLNDLKVAVKTKSNPQDVTKPLPMINFDFQTLKRNEGQETDVISDILD
ncbi:hypothetical protein TRFO_13371 [Tritrichomonas foetus]|uniref:DH domain-containing protein n=1 Tax=Tritrichomonas foetus TaxID=1144522 RepID=A0A1J4KYH1_9EUKA|nr:hypothetical protein TRFO_13371 [Tritrichomonas foetus]|eukprot:OHT16210.1 hypothetical protein TRFO_13371 [Tritrichomonas foetus]